MSVKKIVVYTALFGKYDILPEPKFTSDNVDYVCFTDQNDISSNVWDVRRVYNTQENGVYSNRKYKMYPHKYLPEYEFTVYIDSNIIIEGDVSVLVKKYLNSCSIAMPIHYERDCIYKEARKCLLIGKIDNASYQKIVCGVLEKNNFPKNFGLGENNIIMRKNGDTLLNEAMEDWWSVFSTTAPRDQLSLMYVLWNKKVQFKLMDESARNKNKYFGYRLHADCNDIGRLKRALCYMSSVRDRNLLYKLVGKLLDGYDFIKFYKRKLANLK